MGRTRTLRHDGHSSCVEALQFPLLQHALNVPAWRVASPVWAPLPKQPIQTKLSGKSSYRSATASKPAILSPADDIPGEENKISLIVPPHPRDTDLPSEDTRSSLQMISLPSGFPYAF